MRIVIVRPPQTFGATSSTTHLCPPLGVAYVAAAARAAGHDVVCIDACGEALFNRVIDEHGMLQVGLALEDIVERVRHERADLIGISIGFSQDWPVARALLGAMRAACPDAVMVAGGEHASAATALCFAQCAALDYCVVGEGEGPFVRLLDAIERGQPVTGIRGVVARASSAGDGTNTVERSAIETLPRPAWDLLPLESYLGNAFSFGVNRGRTMPMLASRGCPYSCTFCSSPSMWTTKWSARPVPDVIDEMADAIGRFRVDCFDFYDLTTVIRRDWIVQFCEAILERGWRIKWQMPAGTRSEALDAEVLALMYRSGNRHMVYAPESGSSKTLKAVQKRIDLDRMTLSIRTACDIGMSVKANLMMGLPSETAGDLWATTRLMIRMAWMGVDDAFVAGFAPYPGSALFTELQQAGRLPPLDDDYFRSLATVASITSSRCYSPRLSDATISSWRVFSMVAFYVVSFIRRPGRVWRIARNLWNKEEDSRLEMGLNDWRARLFRQP